MSVETYRWLNTKKASILTLGASKPVGNPATTQFGLPPLALPEEGGWPHYDGAPLFFICQFNMTECPALPDLLSDIKLITFFVAIQGDMPERQSGQNWILRAYKSFDKLVPLTIPQGYSFEKGMEGKWEIVDDQPLFDDPEIILPKGFDNSGIRLNNIHRTKVGGFASNIQSRQWWGAERHPDVPKYCFQIASEEAVDLAWGNSGTAYIARGTAPAGKDHWFLDVQSF